MVFFSSRAAAPLALLRRLRRAALPLLIAALIGAPAARAGGDFVDLAVGAGRAWLVGPPGVRSLDARTGRTLSMPKLFGAAYPHSVTLAGGATWVASKNGYVRGTLSRIDGRSGRVRVVWRGEGSSVQYVAAGAGGVWVLIGSPTGSQIARFTLGGQLVRLWRIANARRIAADRAGCWVSTHGWLLRIDRAGRVHRVVRAPLGDVATGAGAAWLPRASSVLRIDERTGRVRTLATGPLRLGGFQHDLAAGDGALWALQHNNRRSTLVRFDPHSGRSRGRASLPGIADALVVRPEAVWVATVLAPAGRAATGYAVIRLDPHTLHRTLFVRIV